MASRAHYKTAAGCWSLLPLLMVAIVYLALPASAQVKCTKQISNCQCQTASGKYIDLSPLARPDDYQFKKVLGPSSSWVYSYNPCSGFKCEGAENVAVCQQKASDETTMYALGTEVSAEFGYTLGTGLHVKYTSAHTSATRVSLVSLICSQAGGADSFRPTNDGVVGVDFVTYTSDLTSRHACEVDSLPSGGGGGGGVSAGDVLLILFFVGAVVYLAGGFAVNALVLKRGLGPASVPNAAFWLALPGYVVDGAAFCWARLRQLVSPRRSGYESA